MNKLIILIWLAILALSCNTNESDLNQNSLNDFLSTLSQKDSIFIIPGSGCGSCVNKAMEFAKNNSTNDNYFFVFTRINDIKLLKASLQNSIQNDNYYFDRSNKIGKMGYYQIYPILIERTNNSIENVKYLNEDFFSNFNFNS